MEREEFAYILTIPTKLLFNNTQKLSMSLLEQILPPAKGKQFKAINHSTRNTREENDIPD